MPTGQIDDINSLIQYLESINMHKAADALKALSTKSVFPDLWNDFIVEKERLIYVWWWYFRGVKVDFGGYISLIER